MAMNSTAYLDFTDKDKPSVLGNPTEGALLLWLYGKGTNYLPIRKKSEVLQQLTFSTERKYMATLVQSPTHARGALARRWRGKRAACQRIQRMRLGCALGRGGFGQVFAVAGERKHGQ